MLVLNLGSMMGKSQYRGLYLGRSASRVWMVGSKNLHAWLEAVICQKFTLYIDRMYQQQIELTDDNDVYARWNVKQWWIPWSGPVLRVDETGGSLGPPWNTTRILATRCPVFLSYLSDCRQPKEIDVLDMDPNIFKVLFLNWDLSALYLLGSISVYAVSLSWFCDWVGLFVFFYACVFMPMLCLLFIQNLVLLLIFTKCCFISYYCRFVFLMDLFNLEVLE